MIPIQPYRGSYTSIFQDTVCLKVDGFHQCWPQFEANEKFSVLINRGDAGDRKKGDRDRAAVEPRGPNTVIRFFLFMTGVPHTTYCMYSAYTLTVHSIYPTFYVLCKGALVAPIGILILILYICI